MSDGNGSGARVEKGVIIMIVDNNTLEKADALYDVGRDFVERGQIHGSVVENQFDACAFDKWRKSVNNLLYQIGGCEDPHYQRFSKDVRKANVKDLGEGLRILAAVRDEMTCASTRSGTAMSKGKIGCGRLSVSYH
ncbi:MAG: hypothetical protein NTY51_08665 [Deltaproteobacteria bacterium]|nr:hypothetical protein [Deltaproteobacteria bacterium]